jgi:hypothetical protein
VFAPNFFRLFLSVDDDAFLERRLILDEARKLRQIAEFFYCPEKPVFQDATACARCYFSRNSAPEQASSEDEEACALALADALNLKQLAVDYLHPERLVETRGDGTTCGRNYFERASAPDAEDKDHSQEHRRIIEDMKQLKTMAEWYHHPEKPVAIDGFACGRNYFTRPAAPQYETDMEERDLILVEAKELKKVAEWYLCPEKPVEVDAAATGRNVFSRASAPDYESEGEMEENNRNMNELKRLKMTADWYMHPEKAVAVDPKTMCRNYFTRAGAPEFEDEEMNEERDLVLAEARELKKVADWYFNPNKAVQVDATSSGRNYFTRLSAPEYDGDSVDEERETILAEAKKLKTVAGWYFHPEKPIDSDGFASGRNYFSRPSAPELQDDEEAEERNLILKDLRMLKMTAEWYLQPEKTVVTDACANGRNYFTRASALAHEADETDAERDLILADALELKKIAGWYLHPERPVEVDGTATGRNFFTRPTAAELDEIESSERDRVLSEAMNLKKVADWYLHPEKRVVSDGFVTGRNFFTRPSAPEYDDEEASEERDISLAEAVELKRVADWYMHPEKPVASDCFSIGRNYFTRPSASHFEDQETEEECERILHEARELKMVADWYLHPEKPVATDPFATGRNYFTRPDASEYVEDKVEVELVLADAMKLKKVAEWYLHPEKPVVTDDAFATGRNFFDRPSALPEEETEVEKKLVLAEAQVLKKVAEWYMQPEKAVLNTDAFSMGRNFFTRPSAPVSNKELDEEHERILTDAMELKKIAHWYLHPEKSVTESDFLARGRNFYTRPSAPEYEGQEAHEERDRILMEANNLKKVAEWYLNPEKPVISSVAVTRNFFSRPSAEEVREIAEEHEKQLILVDAAKLKKLAVDYLHPEKPVESSVNCIRNYFDRPSAKGHSDYIHSQGHAIQLHEVTAQYLNEHNQTSVHEYYHQYHHYPYADDDDHSHQTPSDHFEMDEDVFHGFRESLYALEEQMVPIIKECDDGEEGKLSRSPSSVMLFEEAM